MYKGGTQFKTNSKIKKLQNYFGIFVKCLQRTLDNVVSVSSSKFKALINNAP